MKNTRLWIVIAIIAILAIALISQIRTTHTTQWNRGQGFEKTRIEGKQYALSIFLKKQYPHIKQHKIINIKDLNQQLQKPENNRILFSWVSNWNHETGEEIKNWVSKGNHLITVGTSSNADFFKSLGIDIKEIPKDTPVHPSADIQAACTQHHQALQQRYGTKLPDWNREIFAGSKSEQACHRILTPLTLGEYGDKHTIYIATDRATNRRFLHYTGKADSLLLQGDNARGTNLLRVRLGSGSVTVLNHFDAFSLPYVPLYPHQIGLTHFDNAYLAAYLANDKQGILYLNEYNPDPSISLLPPWLRFIQNYPLITLAVFLLIGALIWHQIIQTGQRKMVSETENRQLYTHLYAQGLFVWRHRQQRQTLTQLQHGLWTEWQKIWSGYPVLNLEQKINILHQIKGIGKNDLALWLKAIPKQISTTEWLRYIRAHQRIRKSS